MRRPPFSDPLIEALPDTRRSGLGIKSFQKSCVDFHWHFHPETELLYVEKGNGVRHVGRSMEPFSAGDLCLIGANVPHAFGSLPSQRRGARWIVGHFLPEVWGESFWKLPENRRIVSLLKQSRRGLRFDAKETSNIRDLLVRAEAAVGQAIRFATWLEILACLSLCRKTHALNPVSYLTTETFVDPRLQKVLAWIEAQAALPELTQAHAAACIGMSPQAFCRFFREKTGRPFNRYVNEVRIARACGELSNHGGSISEIAFGAGFNNLANFNRRFREIVGITPREYRQHSLSSWPSANEALLPAQVKRSAAVAPA
jgi:AraC-like DNA-binding protein